VPETIIWPAVPAQELAIDLIDEYHEHLQTARILWLFTSSKRTRGGRLVRGSVVRATPLQRYLSSGLSGNCSVSAGDDFIVQIDSESWQQLRATQHLALVDHLLCRMVRNEHENQRTGETTYTWGTVAPDIEEFSSVIERHGGWLPPLWVFTEVVRSAAEDADAYADAEGDEADDEAHASKHAQEAPEPLRTETGSGRAPTADELLAVGRVPTNGHEDAPTPNEDSDEQSWLLTTGLRVGSH
jgi:hypothetical protein